ncbi:cytochrome P450 [Xylariales sp. PMI_506]|nr:cytochrome P450 [Xylariales sp. PMI_506]
MALSLLIPVAVAVPILLVSQWLWPLYSNYRIAQLSGVSTILICPVNPDNAIYLLFMRFFRLWVEAVIPLEITKLATFGWAWRLKNESRFEKYGKTFVIVTPGKNQFWCADQASNHEDWARQRRLVAPQLNERISKVVWSEGMDQGGQLVEHLLSQSATNHTIPGLRTIAMNVLGKMGYGKSKSWTAEQPVYDPKADIAYVDAIGLLAQHVFFISTLPSWLLRRGFMSPKIQTVEATFQRIPRLTKDLLESEREEAAVGGRERDNILSMLVRFSDLEKKKTEHSSKHDSQYLTEEEISGNLFILTAAGFESTANTLAYAVTLLAAYPQWQSWVQQEIDHVWSNLEGGDKEHFIPDYDTVFPKLTRVLAVMYETLRVYPPIFQLAREVNGPQVIKAGTTTYRLEGGVWRVLISPVGLHYDAQTWGSDFAIFRPSRWLTPGSTLGDSHLIPAAKGAYCAWGGGPRVCPGMKMSQVEFTAVVATLFRRCRVEPVAKPGDTIQEAHENLLKLANDSVQKVSLQMMKPDQVVLKWYER